MIEAVGKEYMTGYFEMINKALNSQGAAVLQGITIPGQPKFFHGVTSYACISGLILIFFPSWNPRIPSVFHLPSKYLA
jgi:cyclopropane fatty-acyl-phospholipid synthase-like methyltransferase